MLSWPSSLTLTPGAARATWIMSCVFLAWGVVLPYLARWLEVERELDGAQIGAVLSLAQLARIAVGPLVGFWADGTRERATPIRAVALATLLSFAGLFFLAHDFPTLMLFGFLALTCAQMLSPFIEGAVLKACDEGRVSYGLARGIGSAAFIVANVLGGVAIAHYGVGAVLVWSLSAYAALTLSSWTVLKSEREPRAAPSVGDRLATAKALLKGRRFLLLVGACGLIQAAHGFYYSFSVLVWRAQEISPTEVGLLWGFAVLAEVAFLWSLTPIERRLSPEMLILLGGAGAVLRWIVMGFAPTGFILWPAQALHALSFAAAHVGAMRLIYRETPQGAASLAQTLYAGVASGLVMGLSTFGSGFLYQFIGAHGYWVMAVMALAGTALALLLLQKGPETPRNFAS